MAFTADIESPADLSPPTAFKFATENLPLEWITEALNKTGTASVRQRKLPARMVVWLVVAMALFRDRSIHAAVTQLGLVEDRDAPPGRGRVASSSISAARARLGAKPMRELFQRTAEAWAMESARRDAWRGLAVFAMDGTTFNVADTAENDAEFGRTRSSRGVSGYPKARVVALNVPRSHLLAGMEIGPYGTSEQQLAASLWKQVPDRSVLLIDRGFLSYAALFAHHGHGEERHWLTRAKANTRAKSVKRLPDGSELATLAFSSQARKAEPSLPRTMTVRVAHYQVPGFKPQRLLTSMLDPESYPAKDLALLYHERWEIELGYAEKKTQMLERRESLRSKTPEGTEQELWGVAVAFNVVRLMMAQAAEARGFPPRQVSFRGALQLIRAFAISAWLAPPGTLPKLLRNLQSDLVHFRLPERKRRHNPRVVKVKMSNYKKKPPPDHAALSSPAQSPSEEA